MGSLIKILLYIFLFMYAVIATAYSGIVYGIYAGFSPGFFKSSGQQYFIEKIDDAISKKKHEIYINKLTKFKWEKVCIFGPYTDEETVQSKVGKEYTIPVIMELSQDGSTVFIFTKEDKTVEYTTLLRRYGDVYELKDGLGCFSYSKAKLVFDVSADKCNFITKMTQK